MGVWLLFACAPALQAAEANAGPGRFDTEAATRAYLQRPTAAEKARSDAYFEGGYWLQLWQFLYGAGVYVFMLQTRLSARIRDLARRFVPFKPLQTAAYVLLFVVVSAALSFPLSVYSDFWREHKYGLATQTFGPWLGDWGKSLLVTAILGSLLGVVLFGVVRQCQRTWQIWGAVLTVGFLTVVMMIAPVYIAPLFNKYTLLQDQRVLQPILRLAHANGINTDRVYQMDASRQTTRVSANVSGCLHTMRITLNDNLLTRCTLPEIEAVMAHEIGHYVLNHVYKFILFFGLVIVLGFALTRRTLDALLANFGSRWNISGIGDVAVLPLVMLVFSAYLFVATPFINTFVRTAEAEADLFGLNAARQPDGFAEVALKLAQYRKMEPGPLEEWIFFDHPSGASRIRMAMRWKAENLTYTTAPPPK